MRQWEGVLVLVVMGSSKQEPSHPEARITPVCHLLISLTSRPPSCRLSLCKFIGKPHMSLEQILVQLPRCWWGSCVELAGVATPTPHSCKTAAHGN